MRHKSGNPIFCELDCQMHFFNLTKDDDDEKKRRHSCRYVEHNADVMSQLIQVVHIRNQNRRHEEPDGNT